MWIDRMYTNMSSEVTKTKDNIWLALLQYCDSFPCAHLVNVLSDVSFHTHHLNHWYDCGNCGNNTNLIPRSQPKSSTVASNGGAALVVFTFLPRSSFFPSKRTPALLSAEQKLNSAPLSNNPNMCMHQEQSAAAGRTPCCSMLHPKLNFQQTVTRAAF